ncbi:MAG: nucleotidyltransferase substrate binding protein [Deltaproteobacteria bacterium]|nr:nucleotidyltransferase substrate binding protein [Deltaproteobacteria bacterium]
MATERLETSLDNLDRALSQLERALAQPAPSDLEIDGTIQRFEFSVELFWKTLRRALIEERRVAESPRQAIAGAWRMGWLEDDEALWMRMLDDRNVTSHVYRESAAREVFGRTAGYARAMRAAHAVLLARFRPNQAREAPAAPHGASTAPARTRKAPSKPRRPVPPAAHGRRSGKR